jgi:hypothetical protein
MEVPHRDEGERALAETKYGKYILRQTKANPKGLPALPVSFEHAKDWSGIQHRMEWSHVSRPLVMDQETHSHDFEQFLCFLGNDPTDSFNFGGEVELSLGKESEKHVINHTSIVCIPKGLAHGPINFKKVTRPILFCTISMGH